MNTNNSGNSYKRSRGSAVAPTKSTEIKGRISEYWRRCAAVVQHQRARCYILRRCISMLLCWRVHAIRD